MVRGPDYSPAEQPDDRGDERRKKNSAKREDSSTAERLQDVLLIANKKEYIKLIKTVI